MPPPPRAFISLLLLTGADGAAAQDATFAALANHSVVVRLDEEIIGPRGSFPVQWNDRVYISSKGRIFHRLDIRGNPRNSAQLDLAGDAQGAGEDRRARFVWANGTLSRQWTRRNGVTFRQTIHISRTGSEFTCRMTVDRSGRRVAYQVLGHSCRVVPGNVLARES